jgi:tRNA dimethylallyltransferase
LAARSEFLTARSEIFGMLDSFGTAWYLTGPTAAGKTAVGIELARRVGAEIVSLDSMAIYRGMDIGTAKPTAGERGEVPHHLIDVRDPTEDFSVADHLDVADEAVREIVARAKQPLFVGGTALYLKALLRGLFSGPPADWNLRAELEELARISGVEALHARLQAADPVAAKKLHPNDVRRIIRALEVHHATGTPISALQEQFDKGRPASECRVFVLDWPREVLDERIRKRVDQMFAAGLVHEVQTLLDLPPSTLSRTAAQAVGYRETIEHLRGERDLPATIELVKLRTRQFAKRQMTWFRSLSECRWIGMSDPLDPAEIAERIAKAGLNEPSAQSTVDLE